MILRALNRYYERLLADPDSGVAEIGFSRQQISFAVVLEPGGALHAIQDARVEDDKGSKRNRPLVVPGNAKPSGSGINPCFLWDNSAYALGYKPDDPKPERTQEAFEAFRQRHLDAEQAIGDPAFSAVCRFLESWDPKQVESHEVLRELKSGFGVFRIRAAEGYVHQAPAVRAWWLTQLAEAEASDVDTTGQCLVTGEVGPIARLHEPKIKGVWGAQSAGALLCAVDTSFTAASSYAKTQGYNFPVSETVAFQYTTALNRLLDRSTNRRTNIGDTSVVFWTEKPSEVEDFIAQLLNGPEDKKAEDRTAEDEARVNQVHSWLDAIAQGKLPQGMEEDDQATPFYVLGLSPNAARISVRFWLESTLGEFLEKLGRHYADLEIARGPKDLPHPPLWRLVRETARETKDVPDLLEGSLLRAILTGQPYPRMFYTALLGRIRADREVRHVRAAAIKACLNRNFDQELPMSLDPNRPEPAYQLGRLFAELEKTQEDALPGINDTIKDRYFSAASATPASVFPRIIRLNQHHLGKLEKGARTYHERRIQEIAGRVDGFPTHLDLQEQGLFAIGYYHQRQDIFTKKSKEEPEPETSAAE